MSTSTETHSVKKKNDRLSEESKELATSSSVSDLDDLEDSNVEDNADQANAPPELPDKQAPPVPPKDEVKLPQPDVKLAGEKFRLSESQTEVYVTHSPNKKYKKIVILLSNSLGLKSVNNLKLADLYAERLKCPVILPDLFDGDPILTSATEVDAMLDDESGPSDAADEEENIGTTQKPAFKWSKLFTVSGLKKLAVDFSKGFVDEMWLARHTYDKTYPHITAVVSEIVQIYGPQSMGVIGYSFGGKYAMSFLEKAKNDDWSSDEDLVTVGAAIHPTLVEAKDFDLVNKPFMLIYAKNDELFPDSLVRQGIANLRDRNVEFSSNPFEASIHDGHEKVTKLPHGFAVPGDYPEEIVADRPSQAVNLVASWIGEHM